MKLTRILCVLGLATSPLVVSCKGPYYLPAREYDAGRSAFEALDHKRDSLDHEDREATDRWEKHYRSELLSKVSPQWPVFEPIIDYDFAISFKSLTRSEMAIAVMKQDSGGVSPAEASAARQQALKLTRRFSEAETAVKLCREDAAQFFVRGVHATNTCTKLLVPLRAAFHAEHPGR